MSTPDSQQHKMRKLRSVFSIIRTGVLFCIGLCMIVAGLIDSPKYSMGNSDSGAVRYLGPHGNGIAGILVGSSICLVSGFFLLRAIRRFRAEHTISEGSMT
jgi:hypothetical protein